MRTIVNYLCLRSIFCLMACLWAAGATAQDEYTIKYDFTVDGYFYRILSETEKTVAITYEKYELDQYDDEIVYCGYSGSVSIPSSITYNSDTYTVTSIDAHAFDSSAITSVSIPNSIKEIGDCAFFDCRNIETITLPQSVTSIGKGAFNGCRALASVNIPNGITVIEESTFFYCTSLSSVVIPDNVTSIGTYAFFVCINLSSVFIPNGVTHIGYNAFYGCGKLASITLPKSISTIENGAFAECNALTSVTVESPTPVTITNNTFTNRAAATLYVPAGSGWTYSDAAYWKEFGEISEVSSPLKDGDLFTAKTAEGINMTFKVISASDRTCQVGDGSGAAAIQADYEGELTIPSVANGYKVTRVGYRSLRRTGISSVAIPNTIEIVETEAFEQCGKLAAVTIPEGVAVLGGEAFKTCSKLETVRIPGSVKTIWGEAFKNCYQLHTVVIEEGVTKLEVSMFENCSQLTDVIIPLSVDSIMGSVFSGCSSLVAIELPPSVKFLGYNAFYYCTSLTAITIPDGVTTISGGLFQNCTKLSTVSIPEGVKTVGASAFYDCTDLASIAFPSTLDSIGRLAFDHTYWYDSQPDGVVYAGKVAYQYKGAMPENAVVRIAEGTTAVSPYAFWNSAHLAEVHIPESVTSIGDGCFSGCTGLTKVSVGMTEPIAITAGTFSNRENASLYVPEGCKDAYSKAGVWKDFLYIKQPSDPEMFCGGSGMETEPYLVGTVSDMKFLASEVNSGTDYKGVFFKVIVPELDFGGVRYTTIGGTNAFNGSFDGNGVIVKNLGTGYSCAGLFGYVGAAGSVTGLTLDETCSISGRFDVGGIAGINNGTITHCVNKASVTAEGCRIGGICGDNMGIISYCINYGDISLTKNIDAVGMIGGIAGDCDRGTISNCENYGNITALGNGGIWAFGGIVGLLTNSGYAGISTIENCVNKGNVSGHSVVGGIAGGSDSGYSHHIVRNCLVTGCTVQAVNSSVGAIHPHSDSGLTNNLYTADVIVKVDKNTYEGETDRGVSDGEYGVSDATEVYGAVRAYTITGGDHVNVRNAPTEGGGILTYGGTTYFANGLTVDVELDYDGEIPEGYEVRFVSDAIIVAKGNGNYSVTVQNKDVVINAVLEEYEVVAVSGASMYATGKSVIYNMQGQRVGDSQMKRGIYVVHGKKMVVK